MSKYFYIDSENVGDDWLKMLEGADEATHFLVFYTSKSPHMSYPNVVRLLSNHNNVEFILCHEGSNALDFQLVTYLGYALCSTPDSEFYIVSKDTGYDAVVHFWEERGIIVRRIIASGNNNTATVPATKPVANKPDRNQSVCGIPKSEIDEIIAICPNNSSAYLHQFFTHFYGNRKGLNIYKQVSSKKYVASANNMDDYTRFVTLCRYIEKYSDVTASVDDSLIEFLYKNRKSPELISGILEEKYDSKTALLYRKMFKAYLRPMSEY